MGGNALKNATTRRYQAAEYKVLEHEVQETLTGLLGVQVMTIPAYSKKESFGDLDLLVASNYLSPKWKQYVVDHFKPVETYSNGNVFSFDYKELQIDLICTPDPEMEVARNYFAFNDLGNLMGRIAHSLGMRLGHRGLYYEWFDPKCPTQLVTQRVLTQDYKTICWLLGLSYDRYKAGFDLLEEIFEFVASSTFFSPNIFLLENRNHVSRVRDAKRKTYMAFLQWCEDNKGRLKNSDKMQPEWVHEYLSNYCPGFRTLDAEIKASMATDNEYKTRFNGDVVSQVTGLKTQALGKFMQWLRTRHPRLRDQVLNMNPVLVPRWIDFQYQSYKTELAEAAK